MGSRKGTHNPNETDRAMQDENSQARTCQACGAGPGKPCVGLTPETLGQTLDRVHHGRPGNDEIPDLEARTYCHTCGQSYTGRECQSHELHRRIERFRNTPREPVSAEQWAANHAGTCGAGVQPCGKTARLYPAGWRCEEHAPKATNWTGFLTPPDPASSVTPRYSCRRSRHNGAPR
jgi:hypothetical protein